MSKLSAVLEKPFWGGNQRLAFMAAHRIAGTKPTVGSSKRWRSQTGEEFYLWRRLSKKRRREEIEEQKKVSQP